MSESEFLGNLKQGAEACHSNAIRLLADAEILFANKSYLSCFLLSELALEEMAKGFKLLEKDQKKERFSSKDWEGFTQGAKAHKKKLIYIREVYNKSVKKNLRQLGLNYKEFLEDYFDEYGDDLATLRGMLKEEDEYQAAMYYFLRLDALYVKYDFKEGKWTNPPKWVFASDPQYSFRILAWTKDILSILGAELRRKR